MGAEGPVEPLSELKLKLADTQTCFWFAVFQTEDLSVVSLNFQDLLHAAEVMNPARDSFTL